MISGSPASGYGYDLPGVPWVSYFTEKGVSFHGTYWHNDFGLPRSHGCINLPSEASKWIYRWTLPTVPYADHKIIKPAGTRVEITL
jgi:lipoprotein-anchoring transpeptidase ErfK/SrfK